MVTPPKREGSDRGTQCRETYHVLTDMMIVLLILVLCQVVLTPRSHRIYHTRLPQLGQTGYRRKERWDTRWGSLM
jgi:hypothetical protein